MVNERLIAYIQQEEAQGYSAPQLRTWLMRYGHPAEEVDEALRYAGEQNLHPALVNAQPQAPDQESEAKQTVTRGDARPLSITIIAVLFCIQAVTVLVPGIYVLVAGGVAIADLPLIGPIIAGVSIIFSLFFLVQAALFGAAGWGLWTLKRWGRITALVLSVLLCLSIVGLIPGAIYLYFLIREKQAFH